MTTEPAELEKQKRDRMVRRAAFIGAILAIACQALPPDHRAMCTAVVKVVSLTCGGS